VQGLQHDRAVGGHQAGGEFLQAVAAGVGHGGVQFRDSGLGLAPPLRGLLLGPPIRADTAGGLALQATQLALGDLQVAWVGDHLPAKRTASDLILEVDPDHGRAATARDRGG
jgi:hypothetical protein